MDVEDQIIADSRSRSSASRSSSKESGESEKPDGRSKGPFDVTEEELELLDYDGTRGRRGVDLQYTYRGRAISEDRGRTSEAEKEAQARMPLVRKELGSREECIQELLASLME